MTTATAQRRPTIRILATVLAVTLAVSLLPVPPAAADDPDPRVEPLAEGLASLARVIDRAGELGPLGETIPLTVASPGALAGLDGGVFGAVIDQGQGGGSVEAYLDSLEGAAAPSDDTTVAVEAEDVEGEDDEDADLTFNLDVTITRTVDVPLFFDDPDVPEDPELEGGLPSLWFGQGRLSEVVATTTATLPVALRVGDSDDGDPTYTFELRDPGAAGVTVGIEVGDDGGVDDFTARYGLLEADATATAEEIDLTVEVALEDPNASGTGTIVRRELVETNPADLLVIAFDDDSEINFAIELTQQGLFDGGGAFDDDDERITAVASSDPDGSFPEDRRDYYDDVDVHVGARFAPFDDLTVEDVLVGLGEMALAIRAGAGAGDVDLPLLGGSLAEIVDPGGPLVDFVRERSEALIACGSTDTSPPEGIARDGQTAYCQAFANVEVKPGSVVWSLEGEPDDDFTTPDDEDTTVGIAPEANVSVPTDRIGDLRVDWEITGDGGDEGPQRTAVPRFESLQGLAGELAAAGFGDADGEDVLALVEVGGIDGIGDATEDLPVDVVTLDLSTSLGDSVDVDWQVDDAFRQGARLSLVQGVDVPPAQVALDAAVNATGGIVMDPDLPRPGAEDDEARDAQTVQQIRGRFLLTDGEDPLVDVDDLAVDYDSSDGPGEQWLGTVGYLPVEVDFAYELGTGNDTALTVSIDAETVIANGTDNGGFDVPDGTSGWVRVADLIGYIDPLAEGEEPAAIAPTRGFDAAVVLSASADVDVADQVGSIAGFAEDLGLEGSFTAAWTGAGTSEAADDEPLSAKVTQRFAFNDDADYAAAVRPFDIAPEVRGVATGTNGRVMTSAVSFLDAFGANEGDHIDATLVNVTKGASCRGFTVTAPDTLTCDEPLDDPGRDVDPDSGDEIAVWADGDEFAVAGDLMALRRVATGALRSGAGVLAASENDALYSAVPGLDLRPVDLLPLVELFDALEEVAEAVESEQGGFAFTDPETSSDVEEEEARAPSLAHLLDVLDEMLGEALALDGDDGSRSVSVDAQVDDFTRPFAAADGTPAEVPHLVLEIEVADVGRRTTAPLRVRTAEQGSVVESVDDPADGAVEVDWSATTTVSVGIPLADGRDPSDIAIVHDTAVSLSLEAGEAGIETTVTVGGQSLEAGEIDAVAPGEVGDYTASGAPEDATTALYDPDGAFDERGVVAGAPLRVYDDEGDLYATCEVGAVGEDTVTCDEPLAAAVAPTFTEGEPYDIVDGDGAEIRSGAVGDSGDSTSELTDPAGDFLAEDEGIDPVVAGHVVRLLDEGGEPIATCVVESVTDTTVTCVEPLVALGGPAFDDDDAETYEIDVPGVGTYGLDVTIDLAHPVQPGASRPVDFAAGVVGTVSAAGTPEECDGDAAVCLALALVAEDDEDEGLRNALGVLEFELTPDADGDLRGEATGSGPDSRFDGPAPTAVLPQSAIDGLSLRPLDFVQATTGARFLEQLLGDAFDGSLTQTIIPLLGTNLDAGAGVAEVFRELYDAVDDVGGDLEDAVEDDWDAEEQDLDAFITGFLAGDDVDPDDLGELGSALEGFSVDIDGRTVTPEIVFDVEVVCDAAPGDDCDAVGLISDIRIEFDVSVGGFAEGGEDRIGCAEGSGASCEQGALVPFVAGVAGLPVAAPREGFNRDAVEADYRWDTAFAIGISKTAGPYLAPQGDEDVAAFALGAAARIVGADDGPACALDGSAGGYAGSISFPVDGGRCADALIGILPGLVYDGDGSTEQTARSVAEVGISVTLADGVLDFGDLLDRRRAAVEVASRARINLFFETNAGPLYDEVAGAEGAGAMPSLLGTFHAFTTNIDGDLTGGGGFTGELYLYQALALDAGPFITDVLGPVANTIKDFTDPFAPILDVITTPIPVISDIAELTGGDEVTMLSLLNTVTSNDLTLLIRLVEAVQTANAVATTLVDLTDGVVSLAPDEEMADFGTDAGLTTGQPLGINWGGLPGPETESFQGGGFTFAFDDNDDEPEEESLWYESLKPTTKVSDKKPEKKETDKTVQEKVKDQAKNPEVKPKLEWTGPALNFPVLEDPDEVFGMLLGRDATLVRFDGGTLKASVSVSWTFGPFAAGPVLFDIGIGGSLTLEGRFALGFDTYGFSRTVRGEPSFISPFADGLYLDDLDAAGNDVDEIKLVAKISLTAAISVKIIRAGLEGEVIFTISFDLNDRRGDGKIRIEDIHSFRNDPICLFIVRGTLGFALNVFLEINVIIKKIKFSFTIWELDPPIELFEIACDPPEPVFGRVVTDIPGNPGSASWLPDHPDGWDGAFKLHVGGDRDKRGIFTDVVDEQFIVRQRSAYEGVPVHPDTVGEAYNVDGVDALPEREELLSDLAAIGVENTNQIGEAKRVTLIEIEGFGESLLYAVPERHVIHVETGGGNDTILLEPGRELEVPDPIDRPDDGDPVDPDEPEEFDFLIPAWLETAAGDADDRNRFGGGDGGNVLIGSLGNDTLQGGREPDVIFGRGGNNSIEGSRGDNVLVGGAGNDQLSGGPGSDVIVGGPGANRIEGGPGLRPGTEPVGRTELTDTGNILVGGSGANTITGGPSTDYVLAGGWPTGVLADHVDDGADDLEGLLRFAVDGGPTLDDGLVDTAVDARRWALDLLAGGATLDRSLGADLCRAAESIPDATDPPSGNNVKAHRGDDLIVGGWGNDDLDAGRDDDIACVPDGDNVLQAGRGNNELHGGAGDDRLLGGPGNDWLTGGGGENYLRGRDGRNLLIGGVGSDVLEGGDSGELHVADGGPASGEAGIYLRDGVTGFTRVTVGDAADPLDIGDWAVASTGVGPSDGPPDAGGLDPFDLTVTGLYAETEEDGVFTFEPGALTACERNTRILEDGRVDIEGDGGPTVRGRIDGFPVSDGLVVLGFEDDPDDELAFDGVIADADVRDGLVYLNGGETPEAGRLPVASIAYDDAALGDGESQRANCALGGGGDDAIFGGPAADRIDAGFGDDFVDAGPGENLVRGGPGDTVLFGGPQGNTMFGDSGDDAIFGGPDDDVLDGGPGDDYLEGNEGDDDLRGGAGDDVIIGGSSGTALQVYGDAAPGGTAARDWWDTDLSSPSGDDTLSGETGSDLLFGDNVRIETDGRWSFWEDGDEDDWLAEATSEDPAFGGDDVLDGGEGENVLIGGLGDDELFAGENASYLFGDLAWFWPTSEQTSTWLGGQPAWHRVLFDGEPFDGAPAWWDVVAQSTADPPYEVKPSEPDGATHWPGGAARYDALLAAPNVGGDDHLLGSPQDDHLFGGAGDDVLEGGAGDDYLEGGPGDDRLYGDTEAYALGDAEASPPFESATAGQAAQQLFDGPSSLLSTATVAALGGNDLVGGNSSVHPDAEHPDGPGAPSGRDIIVGSDGADVAYGDNAEIVRRTDRTDDEPDDHGDWAVDPITGGRDRDVVPFDLHRVDDGYTVDVGAIDPDADSGALGSADVLDPDDPETLGGDDVIVGIDGPNRLYGGPGDDYLRGGPGDDYVEGGPGDDWLEGGSGDDDLIGGGSFRADGDDALRIGKTELDTEGFPSGANVLLGQDGQNVLAGDNARILRAAPPKPDHDHPAHAGVDVYLATEGRFVGFAQQRWVSLLDLDDPLEGSVGGDDLLSAGPGNSLLFGQGGDDWLSGGGGDDYAEGGGGDDVLLGDRQFGVTPDGAEDEADAIAVADLLAERPTIARRGHDLGAFRWPAGQRADDRYRNPFGGDDTAGEILVGPTRVNDLEGTAGEAGQDDLIGGNSRPGLPAGDNTLYGDGGDDVLLGDNAAVTRELEDAGNGGERYARYDERYDPDYEGERTIVREVVEHDVGASLDDERFDDDGARLASAPFGDDFLDGGPGDDMLHGQDGDDELWGSPVDDVDEDGNPQPRGESWGDHLIGGLGDDELYGGPGHDVLIGDRGRVITRYLDDGSEAVAYNRNGPPFLSFTGLEAGDLWHRVDLYCKEDRSGDEPRFFDDGACSDGGASDLGGDPADLEVLRYSHYSYGGDDLLRGGLGDTVLYGGGGNDVLQGDTGADVLFGGRGDNVLLGGEGEAEVDSTDPADYVREDDREHVDWLFGGRGESLLDYRPRVTPEARLEGAGFDAGWTDPDARLDPDLWFRASRPYWHPDDVDDDAFAALRGDGNLGAEEEGAGLLAPDGTVLEEGVATPMVARPQHHQGVSWQYGGWGRKVLQASVATTGPNEGDRLMDWTGAYNLYTHCAPDYGGHNILRALSPAQDEAIHTMALIAGAGGSVAELQTPGTSGFDQMAFVSRRIRGSIQENAGAAFFDARLEWGQNLPGFADDEERAEVGGTPGHFYDENIACPGGGVAD